MIWKLPLAIGSRRTRFGLRATMVVITLLGAAVASRLLIAAMGLLW